MKIVRQLKITDGEQWPEITKAALKDAWQWKKDLIIQIKPDEEKRRDKQNRLLWKWHGELANHIEKHQGEIFDTEDIHEYVTGKLLKKRVVTIDGEPHIMRTRTSKLKVADFAAFLTRYEMWAADKYQCYFTKPDDLYINALMKQEQEKETSGL